VLKDDVRLLMCRSATVPNTQLLPHYKTLPRKLFSNNLLDPSTSVISYGTPSESNYKHENNDTLNKCTKILLKFCLIFVLFYPKSEYVEGF